MNIFNKEKGIILIHGLTSTPKAFAELESYLKNKDIITCSPCLPGHALTPEELRQTTYHDWLQEVEKQLIEFKKEVEQVYLLGYCLGGNIAFYLTAVYPQLVRGIVSLATPIWLRRHYYIKTLLPLMRRIKKFYYKKEANREEYRQYYQTTGAYKVIPYQSIAETLKLMSLTKQKLSQINHPTLIVQSSLDPTVHPKSADYIHQKLNTLPSQKKLVIVQEEYHVPAVEMRSKQKVFEEIINFINSS